MKNIAVYLGSSGYCRPIFNQTAEELGRLIAQKDKSLVYGGMDVGLMGILADSTLKEGGHVTGIVPETLKDSTRTHHGLNKIIAVQTMRERKYEMFSRMDAAISLPGGYGTLDEMLEILHWAHLGLHTKPSVLVNTDGYYDQFISFIKEMPDLPHNLFIVAASPEEALEKLELWEPTPSKTKEKGFPDYEGDLILNNTTAPLIFENASIKDAYIFSSALSLKQLGAHHRPIGILDPENKYAPLIKWLKHAQKETFVTKHCFDLFSIAKTEEELLDKLAHQSPVDIDIAREKWGV